MSEDRGMKPMPEGRAQSIVEAQEGLLRLLIGLSLVRVQLPPLRRDSSDGRAARTFPTISSMIIFTSMIERGE